MVSGAGAHGHDDVFGIGGAVVVEELVVGADLLDLSMYSSTMPGTAS